MQRINTKNINAVKVNHDKGFTLVEVLVAGIIMIILSVGLLTVFSYTVKINRGENLRTQALSVLQLEVENYRSLKFVPVGSSTQLNSGNYPNLKTRTSADGRDFNISVTIVNLPSGTTDADTKYKEIKITAVPQIAETGWLANLKTDVTVQRVRSN
jgi:type II secretory pathway pseudopilin PulG